MYRDRTKSHRSQNDRNGGPTSKANKFSNTKVNELMNQKVKSPLLKEILAHADISSILKEPGDALQEDFGEDSFNPPLHSTAVYTDDDEPLQTNGNTEQTPAKLSSPVPPVVQEKSVKPNGTKSKSMSAANTEHSAHRPDTAQPRRTPQKKVQHVPEPVSSKKPGTPRNLADRAPPSLQAPKTTPNRIVTLQKRAQLAPEPGPGTFRNLGDGAPPSSQASKTILNRNVTPQKKAQLVPGPSKKHGTSRNLADGAPPSSQAPKTTPNRSVVSAKKSKTQKKDQNSSHKKKSRKDHMETASDNLSPENMPKSIRSVNELDVVYSECGKFIEFYREKVETDVCKKAVDVFCHSFKEQLSATISDLRKLKDLKRKNAKMQSEIGRKRKRLLEVKNEIIVKQPKLNELQKECSELEKKQESLKSARAFLDNLAHLQDDYMKFKAKNPHIKETYGTSSLPALCLEAENILKAEQHFHIVNRQLQSFID